MTKGLGSYKGEKLEEPAVCRIKQSPKVGLRVYVVSTYGITDFSQFGNVLT